MIVPVVVFLIKYSLKKTSPTFEIPICVQSKKLYLIKASAWQGQTLRFYFLAASQEFTFYDSLL